MYFFHYTSERAFDYIQSGEAYAKTGLIGVGRLMSFDIAEMCQLPAKASQGVVYGLLKPLEQGWCQKLPHQERPFLETVIRHTVANDKENVCLLRAEIAPDDDVYIANYSPHATPDYFGLGQTEDSVLREVKRAYWDSFIPLKDYLESGVSYLVPEVVSFSPIPLQRISLISVQTKKDLIDRDVLPVN